MFAISLDKFRGKSADALIQELDKALAGSDTPILLRNQKVVGTLLSPAAMKEVLVGRMLQRVAQSPKILDDLKDRLEHDDVVD